MADSFTAWLTELLNNNSVDGDVFGEYISGSLDTIEGCNGEEVMETLTDILAGCVEDQRTCETLCKEIAQRWLVEKEQKMIELKTEGQSSSILSSIGSVPPTSTNRKQGTAAAVASKAPGLSVSEKDKLLAQYGCEEYEDGEEPIRLPATAATQKQSDFGDMFENINGSSVLEEQRVLRDQQKVAHESKVERDKQNRVTQKQKALDRKEKEKKRTQKQEKRR
ncbi:coiled-coil domain-containing protein 43-like [Halichondria panicea]|uniref:coiled-coil domain-containing protein 43-like n=1 Tax=Halichondria panicea TaxID=6063 RepID=UPI00312B4515